LRKKKNEREKEEKEKGPRRVKEKPRIQGERGVLRGTANSNFPNEDQKI